MSEDVIYRILFPVVVGALIAECASKKNIEWQLLWRLSFAYWTWSELV